MAAVALYALLRWAFFDPLREATEEHIVHAAKQQSHFLETVRGVQSIKLFGARGRAPVAVAEPAWSTR